MVGFFLVWALHWARCCFVCLSAVKTAAKNHKMQVYSHKRARWLQPHINHLNGINTSTFPPRSHVRAVIVGRSSRATDAHECCAKRRFRPFGESSGKPRCGNTMLNESVTSSTAHWPHLSPTSSAHSSQFHSRNEVLQVFVAGFAQMDPHQCPDQQHGESEEEVH